MTGQSQKVINVIRTAIDQSTGDQIIRTPGVISSVEPASEVGYAGVSLLMASASATIDSSDALTASAYIHSDELIEGVLIPSGAYVASGDYAIIAIDRGGKSWVERLVPTSLYSKMVQDFNEGGFGFGSGINHIYDFGALGQSVVADGTGKAGWGFTAHDALTGIGADDHHDESHAHDGSDGSGTVAHDDLTGVGASDHHAKYTDSEAVAAVEAEDGLTLTGSVSATSAAITNALTAANITLTGALSASGLVSGEVYGAKAYKNATQNIDTATATNVTLQTESFDTGGCFTSGNSYITLNKIGLWFVMGQAEMSADPDGYRRLWLNYEDAGVVGETRMLGVTGAVVTLQTYTIIEAVAVDDFIRMGAYQSGGSTETLNAGEDSTWLAAYYLGTV